LPRDRVASAPYWYHLLPVPPVYVPIYSSHVGFRFAPANEIILMDRNSLELTIDRYHFTFSVSFAIVMPVWDFNIFYLVGETNYRHFITNKIDFLTSWLKEETDLEGDLENYSLIIPHRIIENLLSYNFNVGIRNSADSFRRLDVDTFRHPGTSQRSVRRLSLTLFPSGRGAATIRGLPRRAKTLPRALRRRLSPRRPNRMARLQRDRPRAVRARAESAASFSWFLSKGF
ncbi:unnamed protein product, partial [Musa acuminata var. zebrina]